MALKQLTRLVYNIQRQLLRALQEALGPLSPQEQRLVQILELLKLEKHVDCLGWKGNGRHPQSRLFMARAFVAKALLNIPTTKELIRQLGSSTNLRRLCGWEDGPRSVPDKSIFSRAFAGFASMGLGQRVHEALISERLGSEVIEHAATDGTAIEARERAAKATQEATPEQAKAPRRKRGRPRKGEVVPPPEPTRLQRHLGGSLEDNLKTMPPVQCDWGCKTNSQGNTDYWRGYKLHIITAEGDIPLSAYLGSASMHDSQAAIILEQSAAARTKATCSTSSKTAPTTRKPSASTARRSEACPSSKSATTAQKMPFPWSQTALGATKRAAAPSESTQSSKTTMEDARCECEERPKQGCTCSSGSSS